jgi:hypothetical protein
MELLLLFFFFTDGTTITKKENVIFYGQNRARNARVTWHLHFHNKPSHNFLKIEEFTFWPITNNITCKHSCFSYLNSPLTNNNVLLRISIFYVHWKTHPLTKNKQQTKCEINASVPIKKTIMVIVRSVSIMKRLI